MVDERLESWKEIAAYLKRDESTVRRWERAEDLPVHRHQHLARSSVYAYPTELDAWRAGRRPAAGETQSPPTSPARRLVPAAALLLVTLLSAGGGRFVGPASAEAQENGVTAKLEWSGNIDTLGQVSRDGRYLSITNWDTGDLAIRELATGETRVLTKSGSLDNGFAEFSVPSPDGKRIAYAWGDAKRNRYDLRVVGLDGGEPIPLLRNDEIEWTIPYDWSPDGRRILAGIVRGGSAQLALVNVPDGAVTVLKSFTWLAPGAAAFSPDGRTIAYDMGAADDVRQTTIILLAADGSREETVLSGRSIGGLLGWLPDGSRLLFTGDLKSRPGIWALRVNGGRAAGEPTLIRPLDGRITRLGIEANGNVHYVHAVGGGNVYLADFDPRTSSVIGSPVSLGSKMIGAQRAVWSPSGNELAYIQTSMQRGPSAGSLGVYSPATEQARLLPLRMTYPRHLAWLPGGRSVLVQGTDDRGRGAVFRVELSTGTVTRLCDSSDTPPVVSRDGSVVYVRRETAENGSVIVEVNLKDGHERVALAENTAMFRLSPDNATWVVLPGRPRSPLSVIPRAGGEARAVSMLDGLRPLLRGDWMPDSRRLLIVGAKQGGMELLSFGLDDGAIREAGARFASIHWASVHPDGRRVAISATESSAGAEIWVLSGLVGAAR